MGLVDLSLARIDNAVRTRRVSSWDTSGRNNDAWEIKAGQTRELARIDGPGCIKHIWMTQHNNYREVLLRFTWDDAPHASILVPLGDFFGLGHGIVNSYQSALFSASAYNNNVFNSGCALNCYVPMPFARSAKIELVNESGIDHRQYFYIDYELWDSFTPNTGYFHAEFRRENPFGGWGPDIKVNTPEADIVNVERDAWNNNYVILDTKGKGHYLGCNISVTNFQGTWWGEGDDMIWVDGYKWPPELHGTGSEDYLGQAWGMQRNAFMRNGSSIFEGDTNHSYQTSYVHHIENPVHFTKEIKVTIEHGHGNHLCNEMSSVGYWYADTPCPAKKVPSVMQRLAVTRNNMGCWEYVDAKRVTSRIVPPNEEILMMRQMAAKAGELLTIDEGNRPIITP